MSREYYDLDELDALRNEKLRDSMDIAHDVQTGKKKLKNVPFKVLHKFVLLTTGNALQSSQSLFAVVASELKMLYCHRPPGISNRLYLNLWADQIYKIVLNPTWWEHCSVPGQHGSFASNVVNEIISPIPLHHKAPIARSGA
jgi:hypothetical protein